jgi:hypothetical protein
VSCAGWALLRPEANVALIVKERRWAESCWTHNLKHLLELAGVRSAFETDWLTSPELEQNWLIVRDWDESSRYVLRNKGKARQFYEAITEKKHGVLSWIKAHW